MDHLTALQGLLQAEMASAAAAGNARRLAEVTALEARVTAQLADRRVR